MKELEKDERVEKEEIYHRNKNLQNYHKMQIEKKRVKAEDEFMERQQDAYKTARKLIKFIFRNVTKRAR